MAVEVLYVCDKCGHTQDTDQQMWKVGLVLFHLPQQYSSTGYPRSTVGQEILLCRNCCEELDLLRSKVSALPTAKERVLSAVKYFASLGRS